jgi:hypothetical protein
MYVRGNRLIRALCLPLALVSITAPLAMGSISDRFPGSYQISNVVEDGSQVHVTFKLVVINPGKDEIKGGIVMLLNSQPDHGLITSLGTIKSLAGSSQQTVTKSVTLSAEEFAKWLDGKDPVLEYLVPNGSETKTVLIQVRKAVNTNILAR